MGSLDSKPLYEYNSCTPQTKSSVKFEHKNITADCKKKDRVDNFSCNVVNKNEKHGYERKYDRCKTVVRTNKADNKKYVDLVCEEQN